uniref:LIM domain only protein 3 n=1 Tax=Rhabditophanes sp. KR3021 TaxID=114890 RepID=A0AC35U6D3_9BILA
MDEASALNSQMVTGDESPSASIPVNPTAITKLPECEKCKKVIEDRHMLSSMEKFWHEDCLTCECCECRLGELDSKYFFKYEKYYCRRDYLRVFGNSATCSLCKTHIYGYDLVMKVEDQIFHLQCFNCQMCDSKFCVGDKFIFYEGRVICHDDYVNKILPAKEEAEIENRIVPSPESI